MTRIAPNGREGNSAPAANGHVIDFDAIRRRIDFRKLVEHELGITLNRDGRCCCPFHGGDNPTAFRVGQRSAKCFACDWSGDVFDFYAALHPECDGPGGAAKVLGQLPQAKAKAKGKAAGGSSPGKAYTTFQEALAAAERLPWGQGEGRLGKAASLYAYPAANGRVTAYVARYERRILGEGEPTRQKTFRPISLHGDGWKIADPPGKWPLYNLPTLGAAPLVLIFEGEKCCGLAQVFEFAVTTSAHGAQAPARTDWTPLAGKLVVIFSDRGTAGEAYLEKVLALLASLEPRPTIKIVRLPVPEDGDDLEQWLEERDSWEPERIRAELARLIEEAPPWPPATDGRGAGGELRAVDDDGDDDQGEADVVDHWPVMGPAAFQGIAGEIVRRADPQTEADPVATLIQFLVAFGNLIGRGPHFVVGATRHALNLFCALVGPTALGRKGTSWDLVRYILQPCDPQWADARILGGLVSGEGLIYHVRDASTKTTKKGEEVVDEGVPDKRLLVLETEMSRTFKAMNRESNTLSDVIRQAWDSGALRTLAKNDPEKATDAHIALICHATQADIRRHLTETDSANGFANRFLWLAVRRSKLLPDGGDLAGADWEPIHRRMAPIVAAARRCQRMTRDAQARATWHACYGELSAGKPGLLGAVLSRAEPQTMRLAGLYALLDGSGVVRGEHLAAALEVWQYCQASARLIFGAAYGDPDAEKLLAALRAAPAGLTRKEITRDVFAGHRKRPAIAALLSELLTTGMIHRQADAPAGGRPTERWVLGWDPKGGAH